MSMTRSLIDCSSIQLVFEYSSQRLPDYLKCLKHSFDNTKTILTSPQPKTILGREDTLEWLALTKGSSKSISPFMQSL